jgi:hypothetical protein
MSLNYKLVTLDDDRFLTVYVSGEAPLLASSDTHTNFDELVRLAQTGDESVVELFDTGKAIQKAFADVVDGRVAVRSGVVYFDDDAIDNANTEAIQRFHDEGQPFSPLVKFMENVMANPQVESREQFYRWLEKHEFPIDEDGNIVAYKGVKKDSAGVYRSLHQGHAFVNGVEYKHDFIPNAVGDIVTMPRSEVDFDPNSACSTGLHAGTHKYATTYARDGALMYVKINPRDVVSVPHDSYSQKVRVCRYEVVKFADVKQEYESAYWNQPVEETPVETTRAVKSGESLPVGTRVRVNPNAKLYSTIGKSLDKDKTYTVSRDWNSYVEIAEVESILGVWNTELLVVENESEKSVRNTRENHKSQLRGPDGRFLPKV